MDAWLIVLITISSGIALFAIIFTIKTKNEKKRAQNIASVQVIQNQQTYPQQQMQNIPPPPYNPGFIQQPQQGQSFYVHPPIPSTSNQGIFNPKDPQAYYNPNMPGVQVHSGRLNPMLAPTSGMLSNPTF
jgi:hypothetical protein